MRQLSGNAIAANLQEARKKEEDETKRVMLQQAAVRWGKGDVPETSTENARATRTQLDHVELRATTGTRLLVRAAGEMFGEQVRASFANMT